MTEEINEKTIEEAVEETAKETNTPEAPLSEPEEVSTVVEPETGEGTTPQVSEEN